MHVTKNGTTAYTKYYAGKLYEVKVVGGITTKYNYIYVNGQLMGMFQDNDNGDDIEPGDELIGLNQANAADIGYYIHTDYLGSVVALSNSAGSIVEEYAYDAWGKRRYPDNWSWDDSRTAFICDRGFTGHEHLDDFALINMNGRMYDPAAGQFISPDPFIQEPGNPLNYNRYSYVLNNPLKYTDPSGYMTEKQFVKAVWRLLYATDWGGSVDAGGGCTPYTSYNEAVNAGISYNNNTGGWGNTSPSARANLAGRHYVSKMKPLYHRILGGPVGNLKYSDQRGNMFAAQEYGKVWELVSDGNAQSNGGYFPGCPPPELFSPIRLDENVYQNVLIGFKYLWHYQHGSLPDYEMVRWKGKTLKMNDIFDFSTAKNWNKGGFMGGSDIIWGNIGGVDVMLQNTTLKGSLQLDPVHYNTLRILQEEIHVGYRRIGYLRFYKRHINYYNSALEYIYSPW